MNAPGPERQLPPSVSEVLGEALRLYGRNAPVLIAVALAGGLAGNLVSLLMTPSVLVVGLLWGLVIGALVIGLQSPVWVLAALARRGERCTTAAALYGLVTFSRRFFGMGLLLGIGVGGLLLLAVYVPLSSLFALPALIFVGIRLSLAGPVIVREGSTPAQALVRSWRLVEGHWLRTFVVQLPVVVFVFLLSTLAGEAAAAVEATIVAVLVNAAALGLSAPLIALVETALFEEYSAQLPPAVEPGSFE